MLSRLLLGCAIAAGAFAQNTPLPVEVANLREDVRGLTQKVGELALHIEQLERENAELKAKIGTSAKPDKSYATVAQLREMIADLENTVRSNVSTSQKETLQRVATQLKELGNQTNAALADLAKGQGARPIVTTPPATGGGDEPVKKPATGGTYTVQKGESLAAIAKKLGVKLADLQRANKISDASHIEVGQTLIIPGTK